MVDQRGKHESPGGHRAPGSTAAIHPILVKVTAVLAVAAVVLTVGAGIIHSRTSDAGNSPASHSTATGTPATAKPDNPKLDYFYAKDTPYAAPTDSIKTPPAGYSAFFIENVGRHGSRAAITGNAGKDMLSAWKQADKANAVTKLGRSLPADLKAFQSAQETVGFGQESTRGKAEWKGIGARTASNYPSFFEATQKDGDNVLLVTTPVHRTKVSIEAFRSGLVESYPDLHIPAPISETEYVNLGSAISPQGAKDLAAIMASPDVVAAADSVLERIFTRTYVASMQGKIDIVRRLYGLYSIAPGLDLDTDVTFHTYFPRKEAAVFSYVRDVGTFYTLGPGVAGDNRTYKNAKVLRAAFFTALDKRINGGKNATIFRVAHGETTVPFAALLQLPGSEKQAEPGVPFSYANNPWRGATAGLMAGNIEWVAYRDSRKNVLVTMRYNEKPAKFRSECTPVSPGSYFYTPNELKSCLPSS